MTSDSDNGRASIAAYLWRGVCARRWTLLLMIFLCVSAAVAWRLRTGREYRAIAVVAIAPSDSSGSALSGVLGQLGSLSTLTGLMGLGAGGPNPEPVAVLQSKALAVDYIKSNALMQELFASRWDNSSSKWVTSFLHPKAPSLWDGYEKLGKVRRVSIDGKTGLISVIVTWKDPRTAAAWANGMVAATNDYLRQRAIAESLQNVQYLTDQMQKTEMVEVRTALGSLLETQIKRQMVAKGTREYAFRVIDPALPPERPSSPGFVVTVLSGAAIGVFAFAIWSYLNFAIGGVLPARDRSR